MNKVDCVYLTENSNCLITPNPSYSQILQDLISNLNNLNDPKIQAQLSGEIQVLYSLAQAETDPAAADFVKAVDQLYSDAGQYPFDPNKAKADIQALEKTAAPSNPPIPPFEFYKSAMYAFVLDKLLPLIEQTPIPTSAEYFSEIEGMISALNDFGSTMGTNVSGDFICIQNELSAFEQLPNPTTQMNLITDLVNLARDLTAS
jgi:hypothetical protein